MTPLMITPWRAATALAARLHCAEATGVLLPGRALPGESVLPLSCWRPQAVLEPRW